jgi:hypothetical protein
VFASQNGICLTIQSDVESVAQDCKDKAVPFKITLPRWEDAKSGLSKKPCECSDLEKEAVKFLYQVILPRLTSSVKTSKVWIRNNTYYKILGAQWASTMATALVLHQHYTSLENIMLNRESLRLGQTEPNTSTATNSSDSEDGATKKRKRKRLHTARERGKMYNDYFKFCKFFRDQVKANKTDLEERMGMWDALYSPLANKAPDVSRRATICPSEHRIGTDVPSDDLDTAFMEFMVENDLATKMGISDPSRVFAV